MRSLVFLVLIVFSSCSMEHHHSGTINEVLSLDGQSINKYFIASCTKELPPETPVVVVQQCADVKTGEFLEFFTKLQTQTAN